MTALKSFAFLFTSSSHCCHSLSTHARIPVLLTAAGSLSSHARLIYPSLPNVKQIDSLHFKKKDKDRWTWRFLGCFQYFSTLIWNDRIRFGKCGRKAGVASTFTASQIGRFAKRSCAHTTHTNYLKTTHTHPEQSRQTGFLLVLTEKKSD